ncbi:tRNA uridine-5-carboxymethylaminomethyl(34) synthesis GTPase MnmE [Tropicimonas isoalkanivorans]|uniref:tRNA modification GTPase MnmE n=1 Tax=Tropicimonas isoalkanivorans TaxID=441112 RepID=A0A1I1M5W1_9RHOB|nr:tRNA uridine-5-carboxymethylaminomethyl(34) synthesis GTPase MnmE [Tropicimonas isoalkanivorans]SFC80887.1 tRNA modification GTPase trmE [Tropicimonas isoalkanivorans]
MDTIYALATAPGRAGVAVVRVSGPQAADVCSQLCGNVPPARLASLRRLTDGGELIDEALVLRFEAGASFTGEPSVEFHTHGSPAVVARLLAALSRIDGLRGAEAGEFTRRALENNRMNLAQVEGLADLIDSETEAQRRQAMRGFTGALAERTERWRASLLRAVALVEATIDFADEDVPEDVMPEVRTILANISDEFRREIAGVGAAEQVRRGFEVAIVGPPNAGKSTLLNRLAGREAAITSEVAGTTRDIIEVRMDVGGLPVTFLDTAGLRETEDTVESIGIERARARAEAADLRIFLAAEDLGVSVQQEDLRVAAKCDLGHPGTGLPVSGKTGEGVSALLEYVGSTLGQRVSEDQVATRLRHREALQAASEALEDAEKLLYSPDDTAELAAESIRRAIRSMEALVGRIGVEEMLGEIFSSFCIGK